MSIRPEINPGEVYAGIILGQNDEQDYHLILLPGEVERVTWRDAKDFAKTQGGELPTRREQALLFANLKDEFQNDWYWSSEEHASISVCAWIQHFDFGYQNSDREDGPCRARAVRRLAI